VTGIPTAIGHQPNIKGKISKSHPLGALRNPFLAPKLRLYASALPPGSAPSSAPEILCAFPLVASPVTWQSHMSQLKREQFLSEHPKSMIRRECVSEQAGHGLYGYEYRVCSSLSEAVSFPVKRHFYLMAWNVNMFRSRNMSRSKNTSQPLTGKGFPMSEKVEEISQRARKNFSLGYNCAECVTEAVLTLVETGLPAEVKKLATGFGGGIGLYGDTCGAIVGAVMAVSAVHGRAALPEGEGKEILIRSKQQLYGKPGLYRLFNQIPNRFKAKYGQTLCRELTARWQTEWLCRDHALFCREIITDAARIAAELIFADKDESGAKPFGENVEKLED